MKLGKVYVQTCYVRVFAAETKRRDSSFTTVQGTDRLRWIFFCTCCVPRLGVSRRSVEGAGMGPSRVLRALLGGLVSLSGFLYVQEDRYRVRCLHLPTPTVLVVEGSVQESRVQPTPPTRPVGSPGHRGESRKSI